MAELDDQTSNESILGTFISDDKKRKRQNDALLDIGSLSGALVHILDFTFLRRHDMKRTRSQQESENAVQFRKPMKRNVSADHSRASFLSKKTKVTHHSHGTVGGVVLTLGLGETGQLGLGEAITESLRPALVPLPEKIVQVVAGGMHTACLSETGTVLTSRTYVTVLGWDPLFPGHTALRVLVTRGKGGSAFISFFKCWRTQQPPLTINIYTFGCNDEGSLGRYTHTEGSECEPGKVELKEKVVQISAGDSHTGALTEDGRVFLFGSFRDNNGIIGLLEPLKPSVLPVEVHINIPVIKIASGSDHLVMLTSEGDLYTSGCGEQGQLGRVPERFTNRGGRRGLERLLLPQCIHVKAKGSGRVLFQDAFCGAYFTFAISKEGLVYGFGLANYHQLGTNSTSSCFSPQQLSTFKNSSMSWVCFSGGQHHTICLDSDGKAYCLGRAEYGRLGIGEEAEEKREPTLITGLPFVSSVACGASVSFAVTRDGRVFSWGMGTNYQLGIGDEEDAWIPTEMEGKHLKNRMVLSASSGGCLQVTPALYNIYNTTLKVDFTLGHILSRGMSTNDQLGIGDEEEDVWIPTEMEGKQLKNRMVLSASSGRQHTVLLAIDKTPPS